MLTSFFTAFCKPLASRSRLALGAVAVSQASQAVPKASPQTVEAESSAEPEIVQVVYISRHGFRTPISETNATIRGYEWECLTPEETLDIFTSQVELHREDARPTTGFDRFRINRTRVPPGKPEPALYEDLPYKFGKNCGAGQLTLAGHKQMRTVGEKVGQRYKKDLALLPEEWDPSAIAVRSTNSTRTIETAMEILNGMYAKRDGKAVRIDMQEEHSETMYPHSSCSFLKASWKRFHVSPLRYALKAELAAISDYDKFPTPEEHKRWMTSSLPAACNVVSTLLGHGFPLPFGLTLADAQRICELSGKEYGAMYGEDMRIARLSIGRFLGEITDIFKDKVEYDWSSKGEQLIGMAASNETAPAKFLLMSGHDNTVGPLLSTLGLSQGEHAPMGSGLAFELYRSRVSNVDSSATDPSDREYFVQAVYNLQPLPIPSCGGKLMCPLDDFVKIAALRTPANYHEECATYEQVFPTFK